MEESENKIKTIHRVTNYSIHIDSLHDDTLVELFKELIQKGTEKNMLRMILRTLNKRKKLYLLTRGR